LSVVQCPGSDLPFRNSGYRQICRAEREWELQAAFESDGRFRNRKEMKMSRGIAFILIASVAAGLWSILLSRASRSVHPIVGAGVVELSAVVLVLVVILRQRIDVTSALSIEGFVFLVLCGLCVFAVDYFSLRAYDQGLEVSVGAPVIASGAILLPAVVGPLLGDRVGAMKIVGIALIGLGIFVLTRISS